MELSGRVTQLENEIKILKGEIQAVLLDMRANLLDRESPFSPAPPAGGHSAAAVNPPPPAGKEPSETLQAEKSENAILVIKDTHHGSETAGAAKPVTEAAPSKTEHKVAYEQLHADDPRGNGHSASVESNSEKNAVEFAESKLGLDGLLSLTQWVETNVNLLGPERTLAILDVSEVIGHMSPSLKTILVKFVHADCSEPGKEISDPAFSAPVFLKSIIELGNLLGKGSQSESLFYPLYTLCLLPRGDGHG